MVSAFILPFYAVPSTFTVHNVSAGGENHGVTQPAVQNVMLTQCFGQHSMGEHFQPSHLRSMDSPKTMVMLAKKGLTSPETL